MLGCRHVLVQAQARLGWRCLTDVVSVLTRRRARSRQQGDTSAISPGGVRVGTPALTTRGMKEAEFRKIAAFMDRAAQLALKIQRSTGKSLKDFVAALEVGPRDAGNVGLGTARGRVRAVSCCPGNHQRSSD